MIYSTYSRVVPDDIGQRQHAVLLLQLGDDVRDLLLGHLKESKKMHICRKQR